MRFIFRSLTAIAVTSLLTACGPTYFLSMHPSEGSGVWADGSETARQLHDSVDVRISFVRYEVGRMVFEADLRNTTRRPLTVGPTDFYFQPVATQPVASTAPALYMPSRLSAFDPEPRIQGLTSQVAQESEAATKVSTNEVLTNLSHVVEDLASLKKTETKEQIAARETKQQSENNYYTRQRLEAAAAADQHRAQLDELQHQSLRRNTLEPGQRVRGYVYFPRVDLADVIRVSAPGLAAGTTLDFTQTRTKQ